MGIGFMNALTAYRHYNINMGLVGKSMQRLASGYRINSAADDPAGLAISEKMRGQIRGLTVAQRNTADAISLIQTAEGALNETHSILQRMRELAVQASNGTYEGAVDRDQLNKELEALKKEINRIAGSTHFNNQKLLNGELSGGGGSQKVSYENGSNIKGGTDVAATAQVGKTGATGLEAAADTSGKTSQLTVEYRDADGNLGALTVEFAGGANKADSQAAALKALQDSKLGKDYSVTNNDGVFDFEAKEKGKNQFAILATTYKADKNDASNGTTIKGDASTIGKDAAYELDYTDAAAPSAVSSNKFELDGQKFQIVRLGDKADDGYKAINVSSFNESLLTNKEIISQLNDLGYEVSDKATPEAGKLLIKKSDDGKHSGGLTFQIGANGGEDDRVSLRVGSMDCDALGIAGVDISTPEGAIAAIDTIQAAINSVSSARADLGAMQNRLEHTLNSIGTSIENLTAAESRIRDVDIAKEMMTLVKHQILAQASQAMIAQAMSMEEQVLQLLQQ